MWIRCVGGNQLIDISGGTLGLKSYSDLMDNGKMGRFHCIVSVNKHGQEIKIAEFDKEEKQEEAFEKICLAMKNGETYCDLSN